MKRAATEPPFLFRPFSSVKEIAVSGKNGFATEDAVDAASPAQVALRNRCPRCGQGRLFASVLKPAPGCGECGLDYSFIDAGDGPAVFVILIVGFVVTAFAMLLQSLLAPPIWVHMIIWFPVIVGLSLWSLQFAKGVLIALQYRTKASEGKLTGGNDA